MFLWNLLLAMTWVILTGNLMPSNMILGFVLGYCFLWILATRGVISHSNYVKRVRQVIGFSVYFAKELFVANLRMAVDAIRRGSHIKPGIIAVPLDAKTDSEITILANLISLTPGSLSIDLSNDKKILFVHVMYIDRWDVQNAISQIKDGFERRILEILR